MRDDVPDYLRAELNRLDDSVAELDTIIARANELPLPEIEPVDPDIMAAAAADPNAAPELRAVARAVAEGRTSWAEVSATGGATDMPEVRDLRAAGAQLTLRALEERQEAERPAAAAPPRRPVRRPADDEEEDFSNDSIFGGNPS